jgi:Flp pilus assembly protein TadG
MNQHGGARRRRDADRESGVSAIEFVLLTPVLFFLLFATVQFALYFFARHVAIAAAQEGDRVARAEAGRPGEDWSGDAKLKANGWVAQLAPNLLTRTGVKTGSSGSSGQASWTVSVQVTGTVPSLVPGMTLTVSETSVGPVEQFIPDKG